MTVKSMHVLFLGQEDNMPKGKCAYGADNKILVTTSFLSFLIRTDDRNILFDAGLHPDTAAHMKKHGRSVTVRNEHYLPARLKEVAGLSMDDIDTIVLSHIHGDHTGWLDHFRHAEVIVQKEEYVASVIEPAPLCNPPYPLKKYADRDIKWKLIIGDEILMPGLTALFTPGHSKGHQALMVDLAQSGVIILTGDAFLDQECLDKEVIPGSCTDREAALYSIKKIKVMAKLFNAKVFPCHDTEYYHKAIKKPPESYI